MGRLFVMTPKTVPGVEYNAREIVHRYLSIRYIFGAFRYNYKELFGAPNIVCTQKVLKGRCVGKKHFTGRSYIEVIPMEDSNVTNK